MLVWIVQSFSGEVEIFKTKKLAFENAKKDGCVHYRENYVDFFTNIETLEEDQRNLEYVSWVFSKNVINKNNNN